MPAATVAVFAGEVVTLTAAIVEVDGGEVAITATIDAEGGGEVGTLAAEELRRLANAPRAIREKTAKADKTIQRVLKPPRRLPVTDNGSGIVCDRSFFIRGLFYNFGVCFATARRDLDSSSCPYGSYRFASRET